MTNIEVEKIMSKIRLGQELTEEEKILYEKIIGNKKEGGE